MGWLKKIDGDKFSRDGMVVITCDDGIWLSGFWPDRDIDGEPIVEGEGCDPLEAALNMALEFHAVCDTGEWMA